MNTLVLNTTTGAVSEYEGYAFDSLAGNLCAKATGLYEAGADTDNGVPIVAEILTGETLWGATLKKRLGTVYVACPTSEGDGELIVQARNATTTQYRYPVLKRDDGQSRAVPGKGIRANYLAFGFSNPDGGAFAIDRIEVDVVQSQSRRV